MKRLKRRKKRNHPQRIRREKREREREREREKLKEDENNEQRLHQSLKNSAHSGLEDLRLDGKTRMTRKMRIIFVFTHQNEDRNWRYGLWCSKLVICASLRMSTDISQGFVTFLSRAWWWRRRGESFFFVSFPSRLDPPSLPSFLCEYVYVWVCRCARKSSLVTTVFRCLYYSGCLRVLDNNCGTSSEHRCDKGSVGVKWRCTGPNDRWTL